MDSNECKLFFVEYYFIVLGIKYIVKMINK